MIFESVVSNSAECCLRSDMAMTIYIMVSRPIVSDACYNNVMENVNKVTRVFSTMRQNTYRKRLGEDSAVEKIHRSPVGIGACQSRLTRNK